jgi:hypothetical protein
MVVLDALLVGHVGELERRGPLELFALRLNQLTPFEPTALSVSQRFLEASLARPLPPVPRSSACAFGV